jgi:sugar lactone lactonase YvrE
MLIEFPRSEGVPDGAHIDSKGRIYVAMVTGKSNVLVVDPGNRGQGDGKVISDVVVD